jgi:subtilisin-like proprotein convertase family protein
VDVSTTPHFTWSPDSNSTTRLLEVATDAAFNTVVYSATLAGLTDAHQAGSPLDPGTSYYWRVTPNNACGVGGVSEVYEFTTRAVEYCRAPGTNINGGPHFDVLNISDAGIITDLIFELNLTHSWIGDLQVSLQHLGTGTTVSAVDRPGNPLFGTDGCDDNNFVNFLLQDGSSNGSHDISCLDMDTTPAYAPDSDWDPIEALSTFSGEDINGSWRLSVTDLATGRDAGTLDRWCLLPTILPNEAPVANSDAYTTTEDVMLSVSVPGVLGNDTDVNNDPLTAVLDSDVSNGTLTLNLNGSIMYTPDPGFVGEDSFTYHANDGVANSNVVVVTITVLQKPTLYLPVVLKE